MAGLEKMVTTQSPPDVKNYRERIRGVLPGGSYYYVTLLGLKAEDPKRLLELVEAGFSFRAFERFRCNINLPSGKLSELIRIPARTLHRRKSEGKLRPEESDMLLRASRVFGRALELFEGDDGRARRWLCSPQRALGGSTPLSLARAEVGAGLVEEFIGRPEHGVFS